MNVRRYLRIQQFADQQDFANETFRSEYSEFYRLRHVRSEKWQRRYFGLFEIAVEKSWQFSDALDALHTFNNPRVEGSFASKLIATIWPEKYIWDRWVIRNLGLTVPKSPPAARLENARRFYSQLGRAMDRKLASGIGVYTVSEFRRRFPHTSVSRMKMLDFVLWKWRGRPP